jgi:Ser/Thr protein kinase RdoA (MazF antagonist)
LIAAWIEGYLKVGRLTQEDMAEIDTFVMQRRLQLLAWIASHFDSDPVKELSIGLRKVQRCWPNNTWKSLLKIIYPQR